MMKGVTAGVVIDECAGIINHQRKHYPGAESSKLRYSDNGDVSGESGRVFSRNLRDESGIERLALLLVLFSDTFLILLINVFA